MAAVSACRASGVLWAMASILVWPLRRTHEVDYGPHPLADMTAHYFEAPPERMQSFAPRYAIERISQGVMPFTTDGVMRMCIDATLSGVDLEPLQRLAAKAAIAFEMCIMRSKLKKA